MVKLWKATKKFFGRPKNKESIEASTPHVYKLNDDCLEIIFGNLSLKDLYNVAEADDHFVWAACLQFKRKVGHGLITIDCFEILVNSDYSKGLKIFIGDASIVDTFFNNFGPAISRLEFHIRGYNTIDKTILKHCNGIFAEIQVYRTWSAPKSRSFRNAWFWSWTWRYW